MKKENISKKFKLSIKGLHIPVVDSIGISIFFIVIAIIFLFFSRKSEYVTILLEVSRSQNVDQSYVEEWNRPGFWFAESIQPSSIQKKNVLGQLEISVEHVYLPDNNGEDHKSVLLELKIRSVYNKQTNQYSYNGIPLLIGSAQRFRLENVLINGIIRDVNAYSEKNHTDNYLIIHAILEPLNYPPFLISPVERISVIDFTTSFIDGVPLYISEKVQMGMKVVNADDKLVAEIISVTKEQGRSLGVYNGQEVFAPDYNREKVTLVLKILVNKYGNFYYFMERYPVLIGRTVPITFGNLPLLVTITDISTE